MTIKVVTKADVIREMRLVVEQFGADYLYEAPCRNEITGGETCVYATTDADGKVKPSCIVGQVLHRLGLDDADLEDLDGGVWSVLAHLEEVHDWQFDFAAKEALAAAQTIQDKAVSEPGHGDWTWGAALAAAEEITA